LVSSLGIVILGCLWVAIEEPRTAGFVIIGIGFVAVIVSVLLLIRDVRSSTREKAASRPLRKARRRENKS